jgi:hypothetical protein
MPVTQYGLYKIFIGAAVVSLCLIKYHAMTK